MAKVTSLQGKATGKVGSMVYSVNSGQLVAREYNPSVKNPNTLSQVNQRARLKLASQIAAALAPVIVIPRDGLLTPRNQFIKLNMDFITANNGVAQVSYENLQLTKGVTGIPSIHAERDGEGALIMHLASDASNACSRVVYVVFKKTEEDQLQFVDSAIVSTPGDGGTFRTSIVDFEGDVIIWAYGMKDTSASAKAKYNNYSVATGEDIAQLVMNRTLGLGDYQFTQTRGTTLFDNESETVNAGANQNMVYITASGPGTVSGNGFTGNRKAVDEGDSVTVLATPNSGCQFLGWKLNGGSAYVSTSASYTFTPSSTTDLIAIFNDPNSQSGSNDGTVSLSLNKSDSTSASDSAIADMFTISPTNGVVEPGTTVTISRSNALYWQDFNFEGIYDAADEANLLSATLPYSTEVNADTVLYVKLSQA